MGEMPVDSLPQPRHPVSRSLSSDDLNAILPSHELTSQPAPASELQSFRSLRIRRAQQASTLPPHLRRRVTMETDPWLQSISDFEEGPSFFRIIPQGFAQDNGEQLGNGQHCLDGEPRSASGPPVSAASSHPFDQPRSTAPRSISTLNSGEWPVESMPLSVDGTSGGPSSSTWPQGSYEPFQSETSLSLPTTPIMPFYQSPGLPGLSSRHSPLNIVSATAGFHSGLSHADHLNMFSEPHQNLEPGSHDYFKETSQVVLRKWFSNTSEPIAPPQLYNVPPPASLASQESFNNVVSPSSDTKLQISPRSLHQMTPEMPGPLPFPNVAVEYGLQRGNSPCTDNLRQRKLPTETSANSATMFGLTSPQDAIRLQSSGDNQSIHRSTYGSEDNDVEDSAHSSYQPKRSLSPPISDSRNAKNTYLLEARKRGLSYREIKLNGGFSEAESTLRGRYRMLTKKKELRVRRPNWTETDIALLRRAVRTKCDGRDEGVSDHKISWKAVAEYVRRNGGSYLFGNATCRKKWDELRRSGGR